ncbi:protein of unknown function [Xenorhabdus nematophila AN6/1]|nr:protein of unknown function [Xenorhabdus nematophila AN6/1]
MFFVFDFIFLLWGGKLIYSRSFNKFNVTISLLLFFLNRV